MGSTRENNYDLLRIISTIAVIMIHVSSTWFVTAVSDISLNGLSIENIQSPAFLCLYNSVSRFAVPCFLMLSGAFILDNVQNCEYKKFYSKSFAKVGIPVAVFSVLYILYKILLSCVSRTKEIASLPKDIITGAPMYHMWYMYMLIGIYLMAPIVLRFKNSIKETTFYKISFIFLVLASLSRLTADMVWLNWDVGQSFEYLGYFSVGYSIRKMNIGKKNNLKAVMLIAAGLCFELCAAGLEYRQMLRGVAESDLKYQIVAPYSPLIVLASVLLFYGFTLFDIKREMTVLSNISFYIYLFHGGVWDFTRRLLAKLNGQNYLNGLDGAVWIPVFVILVFIISCILSKVYLWLWNRIDKDKSVTSRLLRLVHL